MTDSKRDGNGRNWTSDARYVTSGESFTMEADSPVPQIDSQVPYSISRVFTTDGIYTFRVKSHTRHTLRLHFHPAIYGDYKPRDSFCSVLANEFSLMKNFSVSMACEFNSRFYLVKEFSLAPMKMDWLTVIFKPASGSFCFVNGIELIEMPELFTSAKMVGSSQRNNLSGYHHETFYRLNVGGDYVSPNEDGLSREWYDDSPFLRGASFGRINTVPRELKIKYQGMPEYVAPAEIYSSSRSMGINKQITLSYNLTWYLKVDPNFTYILRFHLCTFYYSKPNQLVFSIFVNNHTAEHAADIFKWSGGKGIPSYQDYLIEVSGEELLVALHPSIESNPEFYDAQLNGMEVIKISKTSLAGPNARLQETKMKKNIQFKINRAILGGVAFLLTALCALLYYQKKRLIGRESSASTKILEAKQFICRQFSLTEIKKATRNFDELLVVGFGGFGKVYKGIVDGGVEVAIKRSNPSSEQGVNEFHNEINMLSKLRHKHLVSLIGFCDEDHEMCLVYEYMAHGTMRDHLYNAEQPLSIKQRMEMCIGAAKGLEYLHKGITTPIIHRDVKSTNILLDENWVAKVSDFGLSKVGPKVNGHVTTDVKGTRGYLDPQYFTTQQLTEKSDVYAFGVMVFEVLCAREVIKLDGPKEEIILAKWALHCKREGILKNIIDSKIKDTIDDECLERISVIAERCLAKVGQDRPCMDEVLWNLEFALKLQENKAVSSQQEESSSSV